MKKITITTKQAEQFNLMLTTLRKIHRDYKTPDQLLQSSEKDTGLKYEEAIGYAYENIQSDAQYASKKVRQIPLT